jgi:hypothetical protein
MPAPFSAPLTTSYPYPLPLSSALKHPIHRCDAQPLGVSLDNWTARTREGRGPAAPACDFTSAALPLEAAEAALREVLAGPGARREGEPPPFLSLLMLREPWEWFLSAAHHRHAARAERSGGGVLDLAALLDRHLDPAEGWAHPAQPLDTGTDYQYDNFATRYLANNTVDVPRALRNLARIDLVLIADYYDASMCLLALRLSQGGEERWGAVPAAVRERAAARVPEWCRCGSGGDRAAPDRGPHAGRRSLSELPSLQRPPAAVTSLPYSYTRIVKAHLVRERIHMSYVHTSVLDICRHLNAKHSPRAPPLIPAPRPPPPPPL